LEADGLHFSRLAAVVFIKPENDHVLTLGKFDGHHDGSADMESWPEECCLYFIRKLL
jgi:hypothetical protein